MSKMIEVTLKTPSGNIVTKRGYGPKSKPSIAIARVIVKSWPSEWEYISHAVLKEF
ncbi:hypothetical protein NVP1176O_36 [Vibrio phage 1.176.O._10N.261.55.F5]|nr:hypothetical protein NVP1176O_36 [Vibrio phage 1.176.O._10N.261.55.F5]